MFHAGQQVGIYTLVNRLGRGGFGEVWLAERRSKFVTTKVAIKLPHDEQVDHEAIKQEATLWEQASGHPNILPLIDAEEYDGQVVIVSEYAPDGSLEQWLRQHGKMSVRKAVETIVQILDGLEFLHARHIIHRDLKPANILLQGKTPRLADFGISRALRTTMTSQSQHISGTFAYMSPEALDGRRSVQTDVWSVGVNLYQFLTGSLPFPQKEPSALLSAILMRDPEPLPDSVPPELKRIIARALAKQPADRYRTAAEMRDDLTRVLEERPEPAPPVVVPQPQPSPPPAPRPAPPPAQRIVVPATHPQGAARPSVAGPDSVVTNVGRRPAGETTTVVRPATTPATRKRERPPRPKWHYFAAVAVPLLLVVAAVGGIWYWQSKRMLVPYRQGVFFGFSDLQHNVVIKPKYTDASTFREGLAMVQLYGKKGFVDKWGREIVPPKYDTVTDFSEGFSVVSLNERQGLIDRNGREIIPPKYDSVSVYGPNLFRVVLNKKHGFVDGSGRELVPLKYDETADFDPPSYLLLSEDVDEIDMKAMVSDTLIRVKAGEKFGFIDRQGKEVIPVRYDSAKLRPDGLYVVGLDGKYGFLDRTGKVVIPLKFDAVEDEGKGLQFRDPASYSSMLIGVALNGKWGYIDKAGNVVIPFKYDHADAFTDGLAAVALNKKAGFIDRTGREVIPLKYEEVFYFDQGLASVKLNGKWGHIDKSGREITPLKYEKVNWLFADGLASVKLNGKWGFVNREGREVIQPRFDGSEKNDTGPFFRKGLAQVSVDKKTGAIDTSGKEVILIKYDGLLGFSEGLAAVSLDGKSGYVDRTGRQVIPMQYEEAAPFHEGVARVKRNGNPLYIDKVGVGYTDRNLLE